MGEDSVNKEKEFNYDKKKEDDEDGFRSMIDLLKSDNLGNMIDSIKSGNAKGKEKGKNKGGEISAADILNAGNGTNVLEQMQLALEVMKKQIDELKAKEEKKKAQGANRGDLIAPELQEEIAISQEDLRDLMRRAAKEDNRIKVFTTLISVVNFGEIVSGMATNISDTNAIDEERLAAALEPFTNPRRIKLLKTLMERELAANEISQATGLVGGQLYHHLQNLENAGLIERNGDKYKAIDVGVLASLVVAVQNTKIARAK